MLPHHALKRQRQARAVREGSPPIYHSFGAIAASGGVSSLEVRTLAGARKYEPLDHAEITNLSGQVLSIQINGTTFGVIPNNAVTTVTDHPLWYIQLTNNSTVAITDGQVTMRISRKPAKLDQLARGQIW